MWKKGRGRVLHKTEEYSDCAIFIVTLNVDETCGGCLVRLSVFVNFCILVHSSEAQYFFCFFVRDIILSTRVTRLMPPESVFLFNYRVLYSWNCLYLFIVFLFSFCDI